jgi:hypothetical protein
MSDTVERTIGPFVRPGDGRLLTMLEMLEWRERSFLCGYRLTDGFCDGRNHPQCKRCANTATRHVKGMLERLREPTAAMIRAGQEARRSGGDEVGIFEAMIDEALL